MTAQAVVTGKSFVSFAETGNSGPAKIERTDGKSFDRYMSGRNGVDSGVKSDVAPNSQGTVNKFVVNDKTPIQKDSFTEEELQSMKELNVVKIDFIDGRIVVSLVENTDDEALNPDGIDIDGLLEQIKKYLQKRMEMSEEEIEKAFYECGLNAFSLLQVSSLQQFFVNINGMEDFSEVLTDSGLLEAWNSFVSDMSELDITLDDGSVINASVFSELPEENGIFEAVRKYIVEMARPEAADEQTADNPDIPAEGMPETAIVDAMPADSADSGSGELSDSRFADTGMDAVAERDNDRQPTAFNENLFQEFINNIQENIAGTDRFDHNQIQQIRDIAFQIVEGVKVNVKADTSSLELQLNPESLGKVNVAIELKDGVATANFIVRNEMARIAVESQLQTLKETFEEQGLKVEAVSVTVSDFSFGQRRQTFSEKEDDRGAGSSAGRRRNVISMAEAADEDMVSGVEEAESETAGTEQGINVTA